MFITRREHWLIPVSTSEFDPRHPCRPYEEFVAAEGSRLLSYRCGNVVQLDSMVNDPAGALERVKGAMPMTLLNTPADGWTHLWVDVLNHLNDPAGVAETLAASGELCLAVTVLPQFWLHGSYDAALTAMSRAW